MRLLKATNQKHLFELETYRDGWRDLQTNKTMDQQTHPLTEMRSHIEQGRKHNQQICDYWGPLALDRIKTNYPNKFHALKSHDLKNCIGVEGVDRRTDIAVAQKCRRKSLLFLQG